MNPKSYPSHSPFELAIAVVERKMEEADDIVLYQEHVRNAKAIAKHGDVPIEVYVDHTLSLLVRAGYLQRHHIDLGVLGYSPTRQWPSRDDLLGALRGPKVVARRWRDRQIEQRRAERHARRKERAEARQAEVMKARAEHRAAKQKASFERRAALYGLTANGTLRRPSAARAMGMI